MNINLDDKFQYTSSGHLPIQKWSFPAGEIGIKIPATIGQPTEFTIHTRLKNSKRIMELLMTTDAIRRRYLDAKITAHFPYIPYGRQDRKMIAGEAFSLKVFADLINSQNYKKVTSLEPHSEVSAALINNFEESTPYYLLNAREQIENNFGKDFTVIAPDAGALKRIYKQVEFMNIKPNIVCAQKVRDLNTGKIIRIKMDSDDNEYIRNKVCVIFDDIVSRGQTFMHLAEQLKYSGAKNIILVVAHHEGVADETLLNKAGIDKIYTTNSILDESTELTKVFRLNS